MDLEADLRALKDDAGLWEKVSDELLSAQVASWGQRLTAHEFTGVADRDGLVELYEQLRSLVGDLLGEGITATNDIAGALKQVRAQYLEDEDKARQNLAGAWDPK